MAAHGKKGKRGGHGGGEHENSERWLLTYADMITLLTCFFIMLYAMSVTNSAKFQQLAISIRSGFGGSITSGAPTIMSGGAVTGTPAILSSSRSASNGSVDGEFPNPSRQKAAEKEQQNLDTAFQTVKNYIKKQGLEKQMQVDMDERGVVVTVLTDKMLFASGQADLRPQEAGVLAEMAKVTGIVPNPVRVEGHTDNLPIHNAQFPSNWELSAVRAVTVLRFLEAHGVSSTRLEEAGYADGHPLVPNDTDEHRARNRRVEIVVLRQYDSLPLRPIPTTVR